jgi:DNA-binding MarR family transcriptional regulator
VFGQEVAGMTNEERASLLLEVVPAMMRKIRGEMRSRSENTLTVPQFRVLNQLSRAPLSNQELASWMGVSAPTMTRMIDALVKRGLAVRKASRADARRARVECTRKGSGQAQHLRSLVQRHFTNELSKLPETKLKAIEQGLLAMKETLQA